MQTSNLQLFFLHSNWHMLYFQFQSSTHSSKTMDLQPTFHGHNFLCSSCQEHFRTHNHPVPDSWSPDRDNSIKNNTSQHLNYLLSEKKINNEYSDHEINSLRRYLEVRYVCQSFLHVPFRNNNYISKPIIHTIEDYLFRLKSSVFNIFICLQ